MALHFCANLSFLFQENPSLLARYVLARSAGFRAVECAFPYDVPLPDIVAVKNETGLEQILINAPPGIFCWQLRRSVNVWQVIGAKAKGD